jgi:hypothetical protein
MLRGSILADFVGGISGLLLCCKVWAGLVVNATAIIPQTDKALRVLLAVDFGVCNGFLDIDFRRGWFVNAITSLLARLRTQNFHLDSGPQAISYPPISIGSGSTKIIQKLHHQTIFIRV